MTAEQLNKIEKKLKIAKSFLPPEAYAILLREHQKALAELEHFEALVKVVKQRMGVLDRIQVRPDFDAPPGGFSIGLNERNECILSFGFGTKEVFNDYVASGVIAHELGHYIEGHPQEKMAWFLPFMGSPREIFDGAKKQRYPQIRQQEYDADAVAAQFGYGPALIQSLYWSMDNGGDGPNPGETTHPKLIDRINRLREYDERKAA